ncbi:MAG TPA: hypothetical protein DCE42_09305 [Myxococcales bacterium]|nr:hypothetical protein [Deltaproteobacteria bacterium]HAA54942.1 hypothetical protein [Myxococcales bacterium]
MKSAIRFLLCFSICSACIFVSCVYDVDLTKGRYACTTAADCPTDYTCVNQLCVAPGTQPCDGGSCTDNTPDTSTSCNTHTDCQATQTCRPPLNGATNGACVPRCNPVTQVGCEADEVCVVWYGRGYCTAKRGAKREGNLCTQELDCELHLYCRPVKGYPNIRRCAGMCALNVGCSKEGQSCLPLRPEDDPIGYCEPVPTKVGEDQICSGDIICEDGLLCTRREGDTTPKCYKN